jgi:hypothetical protein
MATTKIKLTKKDGGEIEYALTPSAKVAFEAAHQSGWRRRIIDEQRETDLWWFGHYLAKQKGDTKIADLSNEWLDQYVDVELVVDTKNG